jgi:ketosteroid isomerase-like protein
MASSNVDLVQSIYADWARGDFHSVDWADPRIEYEHADGPAPGSWRGLAGMEHAFRDFLGTWEDWRVEAEDFRQLDDERVLVPFRFSGRGKASGLELGQVATRGANLFHVRDGKVVRLVQYFDRDRALADAGTGASPGHENVAVVRTLFDEFARRESELTFGVFDEEIAWDARSVPLAEFGEVFHGHEGVRAFWRGWLEAWERIDFVEGPHHRAHGNQVVSWWRQRTVGRGSGLGMEQEAGIVWTFENGRIVRAAVFWSREEIFRAAGLEP